MNVNKWGPGGWIFLHTISFNYPLEPNENDKQRYTIFFNSLKNILPCIYCRQSFEIYTKYIPLENFLESREGVTYWLFRIHNLINEKLFKEKEKENFKNVVLKYEKIRAGCSKLLKDGDKEKKFNSCQVKKEIKNDDISIFVNIAESKYKKIIDDMVKKLYESDENPNIEYLNYLKKNGKYNINYSS